MRDGLRSRRVVLLLGTCWLLLPPDLRSQTREGGAGVCTRLGNEPAVPTWRDSSTGSAWFGPDRLWRLRESLVFLVDHPEGAAWNVDLTVRDMNVCMQGPRKIVAWVIGPDDRTLLRSRVPDDGFVAENERFRDGVYDPLLDLRFREWNRREGHLARERSPLLRRPETLAPQDGEIQELNGRLNRFQIAYSREEAQMAKRRVETQDQAAAKAPASGAAQERSLFKANAQYSEANASWDMVSALESGKLKVEDIRKEDLPEELRTLKPDELRRHFEKLLAEKEAIRKRLLALSDQRRQFLSGRQVSSTTNSLDKAMIQSIRNQAMKKNFRFKE